VERCKQLTCEFRWEKTADDEWELQVRPIGCSCWSGLDYIIIKRGERNYEVCGFFGWHGGIKSPEEAKELGWKLFTGDKDDQV